MTSLLSRLNEADMPRANRRTLLVALAGTGVAGAWLVLGNEGPPAASVDEPELAAGEETTISADVGPVAGISVFTGGNVGLASLSRAAPVNVHVSEASLDPPSDVSESAFPPIWLWDAPVDVTLDLPVAVAGDAHPGEYTFGLRAIHADRHERTEFDVRIRVTR